MPPTVDILGLRHRWPGSTKDCLQIEHFSLEPGERVFLRGPSGSGKSTLLSLIAGVLHPAEGRVQVCGQEIDAMRAGARDRFRAERIGFIFQQFNLLPYLSAADNIRLACAFAPARRQRLQAAGLVLDDEVCRLAGRLGLSEDLLTRRAHELSVGQQQRVAAARALLGSPALLIADEPTSALDAALQQEFIDLLLEECDQARTALLFVSHDSRLAAHFGRVVELAELNRVQP